MKIYYARSKDGKSTLCFHDETLYASNPDIFEYLIKIQNEKVLFPNREMSIKDYDIVELKPKTKADEVRQMSDEELGELFNYIADEGDGAFTHKVCVHCMEMHNGECPRPGDGNECDPETNPYGSDDMMNWLKMEAEE